MRLSCGGHMLALVHVHACVLISFLFFRWKHSRICASLMWMTVSVFCLSTHMQRSLTHPWAAVVTSVTLIRSRSSYNHTYKHVYLSVHVYVYMFLFFFVCFSDDTWQLVPYLSGSHRYRSLYLYNNQLSALPPGVFTGLSMLRWVCVSRGCVRSAVLEWKCWMCVCECVYVWGYMTAVWPNMKCLLHMDRTSGLYIQPSGHTDVHVQTDRETQWMD
jgi:hypothetical protein